MQNVKFNGKPITLGGREFIVPPLSLKQIQQFDDVISGKDVKDEDAEDTFAYLTRRMPMIHAAFSRNYPDLTLDELSELVDLANFHDVLSLVMNVSRLEAKKTPEGEPTPVQVTH